MGKVYERVISSEAERIVQSGFAKVEGGVVRLNNGKIFEHLKFVEQQVKDYGEDIYKSVQTMEKEATESSKLILSEIGQLNNKFINSSKVIENMQKSMKLSNLLSAANLLTSGLNLCVSAVGFTLVINKLKKMDYKLDSIQKGIEEIKAINLIELNSKIMRHINRAEILINSYQRFSDEEFKRDDSQKIEKAIGDIRIDIIELVNMQRNNSIKFDFDIIMVLYNNYLELNKLIIAELYSINKLNGYVELKYIDMVKESICGNFINKKVNKEMILCEDYLYSQNEIKETTKFFQKLCDYSTEIVKLQNQLLLEEPSGAYTIFNDVKKNLYFNNNEAEDESIKVRLENVKTY